MSASLDPRPVARLFASRRAVLPLAMCGMWGLGLAWAIAVMAFNRVDDRVDDADLAPRLLAVAVLALPATIGLLVGVAAAEVRRRPVTRLLPGIHDSMARASLAIGGATSLLVALGVGARLGAAGALAHLALAALGYVLGLWALAPRPGTLGWLLRVGLLLGAYVAARPLGAALAEAPSAALLLLVGAGLGHTQRFGAVQRELPRTATEHSPFTNRPIEVGGSEHLPGPTTRGPAAPSLPANPTWKQRWRALERFELEARGTGRWVLILAVVSVGVGLVPYLMDALFRGRWPESLDSLARGVRTSLQVGLDRARPAAFAGDAGASATAIALATTFGRSVLRGGVWRPIPRRVAARLEFERHLRSIGAALSILLVLGSALVLLAGAVGGPAGEATAALPPRFVAIAVLAAAAAPWFHSLLALVDRTRLAGSPMVSVVAVVLGMQLGAPLVSATHAALAELSGGRVSWPALAAAAAVVWLPGLAALATLLSLQARKADHALR